MIISLRPANDLASRLSELHEVMRKVRSGSGIHHPILDRAGTFASNGPTLAFDLGLIERRMARLHNMARNFAIDVLLSVKSCPDHTFLNLAHDRLDGYDISNIHEFGIIPKDISNKLVSITSPNINFEIYQLMSKLKSAIVVLDSDIELYLHRRSGINIPYLLRLNSLDLLKGVNSSNMPASRFGFSLDEARALISGSSLPSTSPSGFHVHHGSERNDLRTYQSIIRNLKRFAEDLNFTPLYINLGGGWHSMKDEEISAAFHLVRAEFPKPCRIIIEPGRWFGQDAGFAIGCIVNQAFGPRQARFVTDLSRDCHLKWSKPRLLVSVDARANKFCDVEILGSSCYEGDIIGKFTVPYYDNLTGETGLQFGSRIVFGGISTYSLSWNHSFNGIGEADIVWF